MLFCCENVQKQKIYARKCIIKEIDVKTAKEFLNTYHIQGWSRSNYYFGLFYNDKLMSVMTFLKENNGYTLNRFANNISYNVIGAASKMLSYFIKNYKSDFITTFADIRWVDNC